MKILTKLINLLRRMFKPRCPYCGGIMDDTGFIYAQTKKIVYECRNCGRWI